MITIDQKQFDDRDEKQSDSKVSKQVQKVFQKVIQSMELYTADNLPIITEFLEF